MQPSPGIRNALAVFIALLLLGGVALAVLQPGRLGDDDVVAPPPVTTTTTTTTTQPPPDEPPDEPPPDEAPPATTPARPSTGMDTPGVARPVDGLADTGGGPIAIAGLGALALGLAARRATDR